MAFFGMDQCYVENMTGESGGIVCRTDVSQHIHQLFQQLRSGDVVFIKHFTDQKGLDVLAIGTIAPGCRVEDPTGSHFQVQWLWKGRRHTIDPDDRCPFRAESFYEEFDLAIQRELIDLLPANKCDPFFMVMSGTNRAGLGTYDSFIKHALPRSVNQNT